MGIESRDYARDERPGDGVGSFMSDTPTCKRIVLATVVVFFAQIFILHERTPEEYIQSLHIPDNAEEALTPGELEELARQIPPSARMVSSVEEWLSLDYAKVATGQIWRLATYALLHDRSSIWHILVNMVIVVWFGRSLEATYGSRELMIFYIVAVVLAGIAFLGIELATGSHRSTIGASGGCMALFCLFVMWNPGYTINVYFLFPVPVKYILLIYLVFDLHPVLLSLAGTPVATGVAHAAHLGGLAFGFLYYRNSWKLEPFFDLFLPAKRTGTARTFTPPKVKASRDERLDEQVDRILAKISIEGEGSLTDKERKVLTQASQKYRDRQ